MANPANLSLLKAKIAEILTTASWELSDTPAYNGTGGPGRLLEDLLSATAGNADTPDLDGWEIKFHGGTALLTLFHKEALPVGSLIYVVEHHGWPGKTGTNINFRHTISGRTSRGFYVSRETTRIVVRHDTDSNVELYWEYDTLLNAMTSKCRRLAVVTGAVTTTGGCRQVRFNSAYLYWEPQREQFLQAIEHGDIFIDFDARTTNGRGTSLRNHGTKFRVKPEYLPFIYSNNGIILPR